MKPEKLYHGSPSLELEDGMLRPSQAKDVFGRPENTKNGVYASSIRDLSIAASLIKLDGVKSSSLRARNDPPYAIIYDGWPNTGQEYMALYTLSSETFEEAGWGGTQWVSEEPVRPIEIEILPVSEYMHLIREATEEEKNEFFEKLK